VTAKAQASSSSEVRFTAAARLDRYAFEITKLKGIAARHLNIRLDIVAQLA